MTDLEPIIRKDLFTIAASWQQLLDLPRELAIHTIGRIEAPMPLAIGALNLRFEATHTLAAITHRVWDEQHLTSRINLLDVIAMTRFLTTHAQFLATHGPANETCDEIGTIATQITELIAQTKPRRFIIAICPDCTGSLVALIRNSDALLPSEIRCNLHSVHVWSPSQWAHLGKRLEQRKWHEAAMLRLAAAIGMQADLTTKEYAREQDATRMIIEATD